MSIRTQDLDTMVSDDDEDKGLTKSGVGTGQDDKTLKEAAETNPSPASSRKQPFFLVSPPYTPYIGRISPDADSINTIPHFESPTPAASVASALRTRGRAPAIAAEYPEPLLIKAITGQDIEYSRLSAPTPIAHTIYPGSLNQEFVNKLGELAVSTTLEGAVLVKRLNDIIGLDITEDVLTEDLKARLLHNNTPAFLAFRSLVPLTPPKPGQLEKGRADSEIDTILLFERNGDIFSLVISCKSDYTRGRIGDEIKHLTKWTGLGFSIQLETGIKCEVPPEVFPIKDTVIKQYPALYALVKLYREEESLIARLLTATKPRWVKAVLSPNPDQNNNIPSAAIRTDTILGPRLIHVLLSLSQFRELHEIISAIIKKLPIEYHGGVSYECLPHYSMPVSRTLEQEIETCSGPPIIEKKSSALTRIAAHLNHSQHLEQLAQQNGQPELAACLALRLRTSLRSIPVVAREMQRLQDEMVAAKKEILTTAEAVASLAEPSTGILRFGRRSRTSSMQVNGGVAAAGTGDSVVAPPGSTSPGLFHAYVPATVAGAAGTSATSATATLGPEAKSEAKP